MVLEIDHVTMWDNVFFGIWYNEFMKKNPVLIGFLQAVGLVTYISFLVFLIRHRLEQQEDGTFFMMLLVFTMFATSALISGVITLGYPTYLAWKQKEFKLAIKTVAATSVWLILFIITLVTTILVR